MAAPVPGGQGRRRLARAAGWAAGAAALLYVAAAGVLTAGQRGFIFAGAAVPGKIPEGVPPGFTTVAVSTPDGERLRALWKPPRPGCGVVLAFHGNGDWPEWGARRFGAGAWAADGWGVMAIAYRGYPGSTGSPSEAGIATDALAAYHDARIRTANAPVLVDGHSLGTWPAVSVAAARPVLGLYLESPFRSMASLVADKFPWLPTDLLLRDPMRSDLELPKVRAPVVIVHGAEDGLIPPSAGRALAAARPDGTTVDVIPGDHNSVRGAEDPIWEPRFTALVGPGCRRG